MTDDLIDREPVAGGEVQLVRRPSGDLAIRCTSGGRPLRMEDPTAVLRAAIAILKYFVRIRER
jgi:hypothetical protein